jgi:hypothetical protein
MIYTNVVVGTPQIEPWKLLAFDKQDWEENEKKQTLFTETRFLPAIMKEAGLVQSIKEVRRNKPELCKDVEGPDFIDLKWGKRHLFILVEGELPEVETTAKEVWDEFTNYEKYLTYELVGQALQNGYYNREALVMLDDEKRLLVELILREAMK